MVEATRKALDTRVDGRSPASDERSTSARRPRAPGRLAGWSDAPTVTIDEALIEALTEVSADRADLLTHAVRAVEPRRPLEPLGILCGRRAMEHAMLGTALYRMRPPGTGLTRAAVRDRMPVWVRSLADAPPFSRRALLTRWGVQSGGAVPVMDGSRVAAVIEVLSFSPMDRTEAMEVLFDRVAARLARVAAEDAMVRAAT